jgi:hypothetical protein
MNDVIWAASPGHPPPSREVNIKISASDGDNNDGSEEEEEEEEEDFDESDFDEELRPSTQQIGLSRNYVPGWRPRDAFREFYQNWYLTLSLMLVSHSLLITKLRGRDRKDAILATFNLDRRSFVPKVEHTRTQIRITVHLRQEVVIGPPAEMLLGYILFNKKAGSLEIANFKAKLQMHHLSLGGTTKVGQEIFAGIHGEGFKLAALVMLRGDHSVRISASSFYWNFGFRGTYSDKFYCRISAAKPELILKKKEAVAKRPMNSKRLLTSRVWEDVSVKISKGRGFGRKKITEEEFASWMDVAIDLSGPDPNSVIHTDHGDLILDPSFSGRVYLKGLRVAGHGADGRTYAFCYNLIRGYINRDRERLTNIHEEAKMLAGIWEQPIVNGQVDATSRYIKLFHDEIDRPDIAFADQYASKNVCEKIWAHMRTESPHTFFYPEWSKDGDLDMSEQVRNS